MQSQSSPTRLIPLSYDLWSLVDAVDYDALIGYYWMSDDSTGNLYAYRTGPKPRYRKERMHRVILNAPSGMEVDHINMDGLDNRRCNLRLATRPQNRWNRIKNSNNTSGYKGVWYHKRDHLWCAEIGASGGRHRLGRFASPIDAALAYDAAALQLHGEFARLNFPSTSSR